MGAETIQRRKVFKGGNYTRKYGIVNTLQLTCSCLLFWAPCWFEHLTQKIFCLLVCYTVGAIVFLVDLFDELTLLLLSRACFWNKTVWKFLSRPLSHIDGFYINICQVAYVVSKKTENHEVNVISHKILDETLTLETFEIFPNNNKPCPFGSRLDFVVVFFFKN